MDWTFSPPPSPLPGPLNWGADAVVYSEFPVTLHQYTLQDVQATKCPGVHPDLFGSVLAAKTVEEWNQASVAHPPGLIVVMSMFLGKPITLFAQVVCDNTIQEDDGILRGVAFIAFLENPIPYPYVPRQSRIGTAPAHWLKFASGGAAHDGISGDLIETVRPQ